MPIEAAGDHLRLGEQANAEPGGEPRNMFVKGWPEVVVALRCVFPSGAGKKGIESGSGGFSVEVPHANASRRGLRPFNSEK